MSQRHRQFGSTWLVLSLVLVFAVAGLKAVLGQQPSLGFPLPVIGGSTPAQNLRPTNPDFLVRADVNRSTRSYREGDTLSINVACEADAYVYVLYKQADGQVFQIFPNAKRPNNRVKARQAVQLPGDEDLFTWVVGEPFGKETIKVLASREPLEGLSDPATRQKFFNPLSSTQLKGIQLELGKATQSWAEDCVEINTYQASQQDQRSPSRRFGLFVGLGRYEHIARTQTRDGKEVTIYQSGHRDARTMASVLQEVGQLSETRIITNDEATRAKVEEAITGWLPSVSRPGDTVVLFLSGMAMPISQAAGVDASGTVLPLYDFMTPNTVVNLQKKRSEGKIGTQDANQLARAETLVQRSVSSANAAVAVVREWGLTDDLLAYWLQGLAGRQVIVVLDAPYASAFAPGSRSSSSNLMASGVSRLGDLGQREIVLLGACGEGIFDVQRDPQGLSLMTELLLQTIHEAPGPLPLDQAYRDLTKKLEERLEQTNQVLRSSGREPVVYRPYMVNTCTQQAYLKP